VRVNGRVPGLIKSFNPKGDFLTCERPDQFLTPKRGFMSSKGQRIGYVRVSSYDQNPDRQLEHLDVDRVFTDKASGKDAERPQLKALLSYARDGDTIVIHSMDRLARNVDDLRRIVLSETRRGVRMQFIKENLIFTGDESPMANLMLSVLGAVADYAERAIMQSRSTEVVMWPSLSVM